MLCERCAARIYFDTEYPPEVDPERRVVKIPAHERKIGMVALDILAILWKQKTHPVSRETLIRLVYGQNPPEQENIAIRVRIHELRKALEGLPYKITNHYGSYCIWPMATFLDTARVKGEE